MLPEGLRRQPKARSPASLGQGASQTFFQQIYVFTQTDSGTTSIPRHSIATAIINTQDNRLNI
jgi:hypothetical protein